MKQLLLFLIVAFSSLLTSATIRTVSNNSNTIAQFNDIATAITASSEGDTIEIVGSPNSYSGFTLTKKLIFMGPGWSPDVSQPFEANINTNINITDTAANGSEFDGLFFSENYLFFTGTINFSNFKFSRNHFGEFLNINFDGGGTYSGFVFESNWFESAALEGNNATIQNFTFRNNLFYLDNTIDGNIYDLNSAANSNILFDHNDWYAYVPGSYSVSGTQSQLITFTNNIFINRDAASGIDLSNSNFQNNITYPDTNLINSFPPWNLNGNKDDGGNIADTNPGMIDSVAVYNGVDDPLLNFILDTISPAHNKGNDGKDMGLLFDTTDSLNWNKARNSPLPRIYSINLSSSTVTAGANITATVIGKAGN